VVECLGSAGVVSGQTGSKGEARRDGGGLKSGLTVGGRDLAERRSRLLEPAESRCSFVC
jgi:hypothetical protein